MDSKSDMWRYIAGGLAALLLVATGIFLFKSHASADNPLPAAPATAAADEQAALPEIPEADARNKEQKRFDRIDKDRNAVISEAEFFMPRRKAFAKLDLDHDGKLSFEEWAVRGVKRFQAADANKDGALNRTEFATTAAKRKARPGCSCRPAAQPQPAALGDDDS